MRVRSMSAAECKAFLEKARLGRLACSQDGRPYVVPIHFAHANNQLYAFSLEGRKIAAMRSNPQVCVLVEEHGTGREWKSVLVEGRYEELPDRLGHKLARDHAWSLLSQHASWWEPGALKPVTPDGGLASAPVFFTIHIESISGREAREIPPAGL